MYTKSVLCQIPELKLSCCGCCGTLTGKRLRVKKDIEKNTSEFMQYDKHNDLKIFINRSFGLRESGVCKNVIFLDKEKIGCPAHPELEKVDVREGHCDTIYLCETTIQFKCWEKEKQERFILFLRNKNLDWYSYSVGMGNNRLLMEFEEDEKNKKFINKYH